MSDLLIKPLPPISQRAIEEPLVATEDHIVVYDQETGVGGTYQIEGGFWSIAGPFESVARYRTYLEERARYAAMIDTVMRLPVGQH